MLGLLAQTSSTSVVFYLERGDVVAVHRVLAFHKSGCRPVGNIEVCQAEMAAPALVVPAQQSDNMRGCQAISGISYISSVSCYSSRKKEMRPQTRSRIRHAAESIARRAHVGCTFERKMEVLSPEFVIVFDSATHEEVNPPRIPYQRIGKSVGSIASFPTSEDEVW